MSALTPAHFLIGRTLTSASDITLTDIPTNRLSRYQLAQQIQQHFWSRWSKEYINQLNQIPKTMKSAVSPEMVKEGTLVIIKEDNVPALMWPLGRITEVYPGVDGVVRVVNVRTPRGIFKREVRKICILPLE